MEDLGSPVPTCVQTADLTSRKAHSRRAASRDKGPRPAVERAGSRKCGALAHPVPMLTGKAASPPPVTAASPAVLATGTGCPGAWLLGWSTPIGQHTVAWVE